MSAYLANDNYPGNETSDDLETQLLAVTQN